MKTLTSSDGYWICACVKRRRGQLTHIKGNHPSVKQCRKCGTTKEESDAARLDAKVEK